MKNIIAYAQIITGPLIAVGVRILIWFWSDFAKRRRIRKLLRDRAGKKLIAAFEPTKQRIMNYRNHPYFFELIRFLLQQFPKHKTAVHEFRNYLDSTEIEGFDKAWNKYHGNNENYPDFSQYKDHVPSGLLSRIEKILKFTNQT